MGTITIPQAVLNSGLPKIQIVNDMGCVSNGQCEWNFIHLSGTAAIDNILTTSGYLGYIIIGTPAALTTINLWDSAKSGLNLITSIAMVSGQGVYLCYMLKLTNGLSVSITGAGIYDATLTYHGPL